MENLNTSSLPNELTLCHHHEAGAGVDLGRASDPMIFFVRESKTQAGRRLCTWTTLSRLRVKKWSRRTEFPSPSGHSKCRRRSLPVVDFQAIAGDGALFTVRTGSSHRLPRKGTTVAGKEPEDRVGVLRILLEEIITKVAADRAILTGVLFHHYGHLVLQVTAQVLGIELPEAAGGSDLPGLAPTAAAGAPEGSLSVEAVGEVVMYGLLLGRLGNTPRKWTFYEDKKKKDIEGPI